MIRIIFTKLRKNILRNKRRINQTLDSKQQLYGISENKSKYERLQSEDRCDPNGSRWWMAVESGRVRHVRGS